MQRRLCHLVSLTAGFVAVAPVAEAAQSPLLTVSELKTNWRRYDGRTIRVRGQLDNCFNGIYGIGCMLCPEQMTTANPNRCVSLELALEPDRPRVDQQRSMRVVSVLQETYRFATVTVDAHFDATFLLDQNGDPVKPLPYLTSDGLPPNLVDAHVLQVHARKTARDGLVLGGQQLTPALPEEREAMLAVLAADYPDNGFYKKEVFALALSPEALELQQSSTPFFPDGIGCLCLTENCEGLWPTRWFFGMKSPANPFRCWSMEKVDGRWRVQVGG